MQQLLRLSAQVAPDKPRLVSMTLADRRNMQVDRWQAYIRVIPKADGTIPSDADLRMLEAMVRLRISTDAQQRNLFTPQGVAVRAFQSRELGPVPVVPFGLLGSEQFTVEWDLDNNAFAMNLFSQAAEVWVDLVLWGNDERKA